MQGVPGVRRRQRVGDHLVDPDPGQHDSTEPTGSQFKVVVPSNSRYFLSEESLVLGPEKNREDRNMNWQERIVADPAVLTGKPVVRGTRLAVEFIIDLLAQGWSEADILANYPRLSTDDIRACLQYAGDVLRSESVFPVGVA